MSDDVLSLHEAADELGVHYMTVYKYVRTGRLEAAQSAGRWQVSRAALDAFRSAPRPARRASRATASARLMSRLVAGDEMGSWRIIEASLESGATPAEVQETVVVPALVEIGERWARGELSVADEHVASQVVGRLMGRLGPHFHARGRRRGTIVIGCPPGELHSLPAAILADQLRTRSFAVVALGADTPVDSFCDRVISTPDLVAVGISVTTAEAIGSVGTLADAIRAATSVPIVVGGAAVTSPETATEVGSDGFAPTLPEALDLFDSLVSGNEEANTGRT